MSAAPPPWDELINRFDPWNPLAPDEIAAYYVPRPAPLLSHLEEYLLPAHRSTRVLLAGQRSSGKTTELRSLIPRFSRDYLVIMVDVAEPLKGAGATMMDLLYNLGRLVFLAGDMSYPDRMDRRLYTDLHQALGASAEKWVSKRTAALRIPDLIKAGAVLVAGIVGGPAAAKIVDAAAEIAAKPFELKPEEISEVEKTAKFPPLLGDIARSVRAIIHHLEGVADRDLLLLSDGLDRLPPDVAREVFRDGRYLQDLPCRAAIVAPFEVQYALGYPARQDFPVLRFPNVCVSDEGALEAEAASGLAYCREVFARRLPAGFNSSDIIERALLDRLAKGSGGVVRDFIGLVQGACRAARHAQANRLATEAVQAAEESLQADYRAKLNTRIIELLYEVQGTQTITDSPLVQELVFETMLVFHGSRGKTWWVTHPALGVP